MIFPVYMHFEFDNFEGDLMIEEEPKKYILWRMIPPGQFKYFISVRYNQTSIAYNQKILDNSETFVIILFMRIFRIFKIITRGKLW